MTDSWTHFAQKISVDGQELLRNLIAISLPSLIAFRPIAASVETRWSPNSVGGP